jgi:hypothetical protein
MQGPYVSPFVEAFPDYLGRAITVTFPFDNTTHALADATVVRDAGCLWGTLMIGDPNGAVKTFAVAFGTSTVRTQQLKNNGLNTIDDIFALQITAGP